MIDNIKLDSLNAFDTSKSQDKSLLEKAGTGLFNTVLSAGKNLAGIGGGGAGDLFSEQQQFFELQLQVQQQQQLFNMQSNLAKADHEARMSAIRNMKP